MERTDNQRRLRRAKDAERYVAKWLLKFDGPDPAWANITSSTGRTGFITNMQMDAVSKVYACEVKNIRLPAKLFKFWQLINDVSNKFKKEPLLVIIPTNEGLGLRKHYPALHVMTEERHGELLEIEKQYAALIAFKS